MKARGKISFGVSFLWDEMIATDLTTQLPELDVPVYYFHGICDYTCSYMLAREYFEKLEAPLKSFYTFEYSAHSPFLEELKKTQTILQEDVLLGANNIANER